MQPFTYGNLVLNLLQKSSLFRKHGGELLFEDIKGWHLLSLDANLDFQHGQGLLQVGHLLHLHPIAVMNLENRESSLLNQLLLRCIYASEHTQTNLEYVQGAMHP